LNAYSFLSFNRSHLGDSLAIIIRPIHEESPIKLAICIKKTASFLTKRINMQKTTVVIVSIAE